MQAFRVAGFRLVMALAVVLLAPPAVRAQGAAAPPVAWHITDLGVLPGAVLSHANAVNDRGMAVGGAYLGSDDRPVAWTAGRPRDLGSLQAPPQGPLGGEANAVNGAGQVVGRSWVVSPQGQWMHAFAWQNGRLRDLAPQYLQSGADGINDRGTIVGHVGDNDTIRAAMWRGDSLTLLTPSRPGLSAALDVNESDQVVGQMQGGNGYAQAFLWDSGRFSILPSLPGAVGWAARAISDGGQIVGVSDSARGWTAVVWRDGQPVDLGGLPGAYESTATGINDDGLIVGYSRATEIGQTQAVMWRDGRITALDTLPGVARSGWRLTYASDVNAAGQVVGSGIDPQGRYHGFLLSPVPEPGTLVLLGAGLALVLGRARARGLPPSAS